MADGLVPGRAYESFLPWIQAQVSLRAVRPMLMWAGYGDSCSDFAETVGRIAGDLIETARLFGERAEGESSARTWRRQSRLQTS
jgi:hypothetical protein